MSAPWAHLHSTTPTQKIRSNQISSLSPQVDGQRDFLASPPQKMTRLGHGPCSPPSSTPPLTWVEKEDRPLAMLRENKLAFVNRKDTVIELMKLHQSNFYRARDCSGEDFSIPFVDNLWGMGKSSLAENYLWECRKYFDAAEAPEEFQQALQSARTVILRIGRGKLYTAMGNNVAECYSVIVDAFVNRIKVMKSEITGSTKRIEACAVEIDPPYKAFRAFIEETQRPLFLVIDEIGAAFTAGNGTKRSLDQAMIEKERFLGFCTEVVDSWLTLPDLFILFTGREEFLDLINNQHPLNDESLGSREYLHRIRLNMIRREYIPHILANTWRMTNGRLMNLDETFGINPVAGSVEIEQKRVKFIDALLARTNGHPRLMLRMLRGSTDYDTFVQSTEVVNSDYGVHLSLDEWLSNLLPHQKCIMDMLKDACDTVTGEPEQSKKRDLTVLSFPEMKNSLSLAHVAARAFIRWEGDVRNATLFVSRAVKERLAIMFMPFHAFIAEIRLGSEVIMSAYANFERCCQKRFQELFPAEGKGQFPKLVDSWFSSSRFIPELKLTLNLGSEISFFPKITKSGSTEFTDLSQATAHPDLWPSIRQAMIEKNRSTCFIPRERSASSDVVFVTQGVPFRNSFYLVTIGLAVKCYQGSLNAIKIEDERELFNRMFVDARRDTSGNEVNILIVCNTGTYATHEMADDLLNIVLTDDERYPYIHETILLNLSTADLRRNFFGLVDESRCAANLEALVAKEFPLKSDP